MNKITTSLAILAASTTMASAALTITITETSATTYSVEFGGSLSLYPASNVGSTGFGDFQLPSPLFSNAWTLAYIELDSFGDWVSTESAHTNDSGSIGLSYQDLIQGGSPLPSVDLTADDFTYNSSDNTFELDVSSGTLPTFDSGNLVVSGTLNATMTAGGGAGFTDYFNVGTYTDTYNGENVTINVVPIPEPSSAALLGLGSLALILRRRK